VTNVARADEECFMSSFPVPGYDCTCSDEPGVDECQCCLAGGFCAEIRRGGVIVSCRNDGCPASAATCTFNPLPPAPPINCSCR
jgi:hypothetical protein